jgi:Tfp pilus assembly protein PilF
MGVMSTAYATVTPAQVSVAQSAEALVNQGVKQYQQGNYQAAIKRFNQALKIDAELAQAYYTVVLVTLNDADFNGA